METVERPGTTLTIDPRFRGPDRSGNGGYVCGLLARYVDDAAEVTLRRPAPVAYPLSLVRGDAGVRLFDGESLIAEARPSAAPIEPPPPVSFDAATRVATHPSDLAGHPFPGCFVCGPDRQDGLRIFPGEVGDGLIAGPWTPRPELAGGDGRLASVFVWAALDCPSGWAAGTLVAPGTVALLGRFSSAICDRPAANEPCVIVACADGRQGRKLAARSALYTASGRLLAAAAATWVTIQPRR